MSFLTCTRLTAHWVVSDCDLGKVSVYAPSKGCVGLLIHVVGCGMGDSGPTHEVDTFSSRADDFHIGDILLVVYSRDSPATWSTSIHSVG